MCPGFLCGAVFCAVLGITGSGRGLDELPLSRVAAWGAATGLLVGVLPFTIGESTSRLALWQLAAIVIGFITLLSAASAVGSAMVARILSRRHTLTGAAAEG
jgi:hypothetical protein